MTATLDRTSAELVDALARGEVELLDELDEPWEWSAQPLDAESMRTLEAKPLPNPPWKDLVVTWVSDRDTAVAGMEILHGEMIEERRSWRPIHLQADDVLQVTFGET